MMILPLTQQLAASLGFVLLALIIWRAATSSKLIALLTAVSVLLSLSLTGLFIIANQLTGNGIDQSIVFHLLVGIEGAGLSDFSGAISASILIAAAIFLISYIAYRLCLSRVENSHSVFRIVLGGFVVAASFLTNPASSDIYSLLRGTLLKVPTAARHPPELFVPLERVEFGQTQKNFVYLFLESVERTYLDDALFPGLMPNLTALEEQAFSFTNIDQVEGTSWTIAGMTAAQCGLPLNGFTGNSMSGVDQFLPRAVCLGDLLKEHDYDLHYIGGADLEFAGKGNFFRTHGFNSIQGRDELTPSLTDESYQSPWGLFDDSMYEIAKERFDELAAGDKPFGLVLLTVDTHHPNGHMSRSCGDLKYGDGGNAILNAVHCADVMLGDFVEHIRSSPLAEDTVLIVASDHLAMPNTAWSTLSAADRNNLLMILDTTSIAGRDDRPGSTLDVGPTLLSLIGAESNAFGFGRSLLADAPTLSESLPDIDSYIRESAPFLASLWSFPQLDSGIVMDQSNDRLVLGDHSVGYPALFSVDGDMQVTALQFEFYADHPLQTQVQWLGFDQRFVWIDRCEATMPLAGVSAQTTEPFCSLIGTLGGTEMTHVVLNDKDTLTYAAISEALSRPAGTEEDARRRIADKNIFRRLGGEEPEAIVGSATLDGRYLLRSAGFGHGASTVTNLLRDTEVALERGISVIGMNNTDPPITLFHKDTCAWAEEIVHMTNVFPTVSETVAGYAPFFGGIAVVVDDSAVCGAPVSMQEIFGDGPFQMWDQIDNRTPYIGVLRGDGSVVERSGQLETAISVVFTEFLDVEKKLPVQRQLESLPRIAHAAGLADGERYSNSLQALDQNEPYFELFEIDFVWTTDNKLVCLHDWTTSFHRAFNVDFDGPIDLSSFETLSASSRFENCTLQTLIAWLDQNPSAHIVTDVKERNTDALHLIASEYPDFVGRFVPQIYQPHEYPEVRSLGFSNILWTLYRYRGGAERVLSWLHFMDLYGLVMPISSAESGLARQASHETGVLVWSHTINDQRLLEQLQKAGVTEVMTDGLLPE
jgi:phosphoglycerol transferase